MMKMAHLSGFVLNIGASNANVILWTIRAEAFQRCVLLAQVQHVVVSSESRQFRFMYCQKITHVALEILPGWPAESFRYIWIL